MIDEDSQVFSSPYWFGAVLNEDKVVGCGLHSLPDGLLLSDISQSGINDLVADLLTAVSRPNRVHGPPGTVQEVVKTIDRLGGLKLRLERRWNVLKLTLATGGLDTDAEQLVKGELSKGSKKDASLIERIGLDYAAEKPAPINVAHFLLRKLGEGSLYVWRDPNIKCIAAISARSALGARISAIYTPLVDRGCGYATSLLRSLSQKLCEEGIEFITLAVEQNDRSQALYQRVGFSIIGERHCYAMTRRARVSDQ